MVFISPDHKALFPGGLVRGGRLTSHNLSVRMTGKINPLIHGAGIFGVLKFTTWSFLPCN